MATYSSARWVVCHLQGSAAPFPLRKRSGRLVEAGDRVLWFDLNLRESVELPADPVFRGVMEEAGFEEIQFESDVGEFSVSVFPADLNQAKSILRVWDATPSASGLQRFIAKQDEWARGRLRRARLY